MLLWCYCRTVEDHWICTSLEHWLFLDSEYCIAFFKHICPSRCLHVAWTRNLCVWFVYLLRPFLFSSSSEIKCSGTWPVKQGAGTLLWMRNTTGRTGIRKMRDSPITFLGIHRNGWWHFPFSCTFWLSWASLIEFEWASVSRAKNLACWYHSKQADDLKRIMVIHKLNNSLDEDDALHFFDIFTIVYSF